MRTVHLLVNPASRRGRADGEAVEAGLVGLGVRVERIETSGPDHVASAIERAQPGHVVAVGGDGLIHRALPALVATETPVGIVSSGTGNDFARALGLPRRRSQAIERAIGPTTPVDLLRVVQVDGSVSLVATVVTAGFSGRVNGTANQRSFPRGQLKYTAASFTELRRLVSFPLRTGIEVLDGPCTFFAVANTRFFGGGMAIAPEADPTDGSLHVTVVGDVPAWQLALVLPSVFLGQHVRHPKVHQHVCRRIAIEHDQEVWADGELIGSGPIEVDVMPGALLVAAL